MRAADVISVTVHFLFPSVLRRLSERIKRVVAAASVAGKQASCIDSLVPVILVGAVINMIKK